MLKKSFEIITDIMKPLLPVAADMAKTGVRVTGKLTGRLGGLAASFLRKRFGIKTRGVKRKVRKALRVTMLVSGAVSVLSFAGLLMSHKK